MISKKDSQLNTICLKGFLLRIVVLIVVSIFSKSLTTGYLRSDYHSDDLRYLDGAVYYGQHADSLIDISTFADAYLLVGDYTGFSSSFALWYWMVCILGYIFKYAFVLKTINILFSVACIFFIYKLCRLVYPDNLQVANIASKLYAYLPYPVFFSCFLYKDQFLTLVLLLILYKVYKWDTILTPKRLLVLVLLFSAFTFLRSGLLPVLILCIAFIELRKKRDGINIKVLLSFVVILIVAYFTLGLYTDTIALKLNAYVDSRANNSDLTNSTIRYFLINNWYDVWKLPFSFLFTIIQPLFIGNPISNWEGVVGVFNYVFLPIAICNIAYMVKRKKGNSTFYYATMILFIVMLYVSMGITRHFFFLMFLPMIYFADYNSLYKKESAFVIKISSVISIFLFIASAIVNMWVH